jgi:hypothetical protein
MFLSKAYFAALTFRASAPFGQIHTVNIRKQGGAAVITTPPDVLRTLHSSVGATLSIECDEDAVRLRPTIKKT